jgi:transposase-like protein
MTVELSKTRHNIIELVQELGIEVELIYRWRSELLEKGAGSFPGYGKPKHSPEEAKIAGYPIFLLSGLWSDGYT